VAIIRPTQRVTWMELFYDVIVAATMLLIYGSLAKHLSWPEFFWLSAVALVVFSMWLSTTLIFNRLPDDSPMRRLFVIAQMITLVYAVASMENSDRVDGDVGIVALAIAMLIMAAMWEYVRRSVTDSFGSDRQPVIFLVIGAVFLMSAALLPDSLNASVFVIGALIGFTPIFVTYVPSLCRAGLLDFHHLVERLGGLVLIMLGETFLEMAVLFTKGGEPRAFGVVLVLALLTVIWWQYFTYISGSPRLTTRSRMIEFLVGHALLILGLGSAALSLTEVALALTEQLSLPILAGMLGGSLALIYAGFSVISFTTTDSRGQTALLALAAAVFGVLGLLFWSTWEVDEQLLTLVFGGLSVVTLIVTEFIRRKAANRVNLHVDTPTS
jgi:low temperature requirement protein LtrA